MTAIDAAFGALDEAIAKAKGLLHRGTSHSLKRVRRGLHVNRAATVALNAPAKTTLLGAGIGAALAGPAGAKVGAAAGELAGHALTVPLARGTAKLIQRGARLKRALNYLRNRKQGEKLPHKGQFAPSAPQFKLKHFRASLREAGAHTRQQRLRRKLWTAFPKPARAGVYKSRRVARAIQET